MSIRAFVIIISFLLLVLPSAIQAQWELMLPLGNLDPESADTTLRSFDVVGQDLIYALGPIIDPLDIGFYVFKSEDGGTNWESFQLPFGGGLSYTYKTISFLNDTLGYITGWKDNQPGTETPFIRALLVMRTIDGGESWTEHFVSSEYGLGNSGDFDAGFLDDGRLIITEEGIPGTYFSNLERTEWFPVEIGANGHHIIYNDVITTLGGGYGLVSIDEFESSTLIQLFEDGSVNAGDMIISSSDTIVLACGIGQSGWTYGYSQNNYGVFSSNTLSAINNSMHHCLDYYSFSDIENITDRMLLISSNPYNGYPFLMSPEGSDEWFSQEFELGPFEGTQLPRKIICIDDAICYAMGPYCLYRTENAGGPGIEPIPFTEVTFTTGISEETGISFQIGPNPFSERLEIQSESITSGEMQLQFHDLQGRLVLEESLQVEAGRIIWSEGSTLVTGTYLMSLIQDGKRLFTVQVLRE